ncbi:hypothetical protein [Rossellomorea marisflavi]|uniref:hypothetical protein n=1 Tax=Rossellomorea marisflavi TaxID=189381 RepID=UPI0035157EEA
MKTGLASWGKLTFTVVIGRKVHWEAGGSMCGQVSAFDLHQEAVRGEEAASRAEEGRVQILVMDKLNGLPQLLRFLFRKKVMKRNPVNFMVAGSSSTWERRESGRCGDDRSEKGMRGCSSDLGEKKPDLLLLEPFPLVVRSRWRNNWRIDRPSWMIAKERNRRS